MQQYLFEYKVKYTKNYYNDNYLRYELPGNDIPEESESGIRLVTAGSYHEAYKIMEINVRLIHNLNDDDRFYISITDLNI